MRETWLVDHFYLGVEHYRPKSKGGKARLRYANLLYACNKCNQAKGTKPFKPALHPEEFPYGKAIKVQKNGNLKTTSTDHKWLIKTLNLNRESLRLFRAEVQEHWDLARELAAGGNARATEILMNRFRWPHDMPTLKELSALGRARRPYSERPDRKPWY